MKRSRSDARLGCLAGLLDGRDDVGISATAADVAAHRFLHVGICRAARLLGERHGGHDLAGGAVAALVAIAGDESRPASGAGGRAHRGLRWS